MMRKEMNPNRKTAIIVGVFYIVSALGLLSLLTLSQEYVKAGSPAASYFQILGALMPAVRIWAIFVFGVIAFSLGALMYYYVFYQSKLIPRWLSGWGLKLKDSIHLQSLPGLQKQI